MSFIVTTFNEIIFKPIVNLLVVVVGIVPGNGLWVAIIAVTVLIRLVLAPLSHKALKSQRLLAKMQPEIKKIQKQHKDDKQKQSMAMMEFYKEKGINPLGGCLPFILQIPIIIGMYRVFLLELKGESFTALLYPFVEAPAHIETTLFGLGSLTEAGQLSLIFGLLAGFAQFVLSKLTLSQKEKTDTPKKTDKGTPDFQNIMGKQMTYVLPVVTVFIAQSFPAGLALYWFTTTVFSIGQQYVINKKIG